MLSCVSPSIFWVQLNLHFWIQFSSRELASFVVYVLLAWFMSLFTLIYNPGRFIDWAFSEIWPFLWQLHSCLNIINKIFHKRVNFFHCFIRKNFVDYGVESLWFYRNWVIRKIWKKTDFIVKFNHDCGVLRNLSVSIELSIFEFAFATILIRFFASKLKINHDISLFIIKPMTWSWTTKIGKE